MFPSFQVMVIKMQDMVITMMKTEGVAAVTIRVPMIVGTIITIGDRTRIDIGVTMISALGLPRQHLFNNHQR